MAILEGLNEKQKKAVLKTDGPLLIVAGAGSGKTKTIAHRIAHLIEGGVAPEKILAVTFTNKAAGEMKERVHSLLKREHISQGSLGGPFMGTFHSLGVHMIRAHGSVLGIPKHFSIMDSEDSRKIIKELVEELGLDPDSFAPLRVKANISRLKNELISADEFARDADQSPYQNHLRDLYVAYEAKLQKIKGLDFDDLLLKNVMMLQKSDTVREYWQNKWSHIHIDEYQDTNRAQYTLSKILAQDSRNIAVVGDVDQAIYSWRGADWRNILQFEIDWRGAEIITLEENYRSTKRILEAANAVILNNTQRKEKTLYSQKGEGDALVLTVLEDEKQEAAFIVEYLKSLKREGVGFDEMAVLFRTNAQSRALEEGFIKRMVPYRLIAGVKFYERKEIKDLLAYLRYTLNKSDDVSLKRILNTPTRGIGKVLTLKYFGAKDYSNKESEKIKKFESIIEKIEKSINTKQPKDVLRTIMSEAGFNDYYKNNKFEEDRFENIKELLSVADKFDEEKPPLGIEKLLMEASLSTQDTEVENRDGSVTLLTAHAAKGLEFNVIIIAGMEEGLFPHSMSQDPQELEEERRLFYVALTRAKNKVLITLTRHRMLYGETSFNDPSRFLGEIPEHLITGADLSLDTEDYEEEKIQI
ncbi:MAG: exodeoxyribonuclease V subunit gamma [bacterium]|nr:exodeoxyribonuclease V subunit gamma [bacterium]